MQNIRIIIYGFVDILAGIAAVLSLGFYYPTWAMDIAVYFTKRDCKKEEI